MGLTLIFHSQLLIYYLEEGTLTMKEILVRRELQLKCMGFN